MIGLDTKVLVRYIMQDDARQSAQATTLIEALTVDEPGFVSIISVVELGWVLSHAGRGAITAPVSCSWACTSAVT